MLKNTWVLLYILKKGVNLLGNLLRICLHSHVAVGQVNEEQCQQERKKLGEKLVCQRMLYDLKEEELLACFHIPD